MCVFQAKGNWMGLVEFGFGSVTPSKSKLKRLPMTPDRRHPSTHPMLSKWRREMENF